MELCHHSQTDQLRKDSFGWNDLATEAFKSLKTAITKAPVLALPDFNKKFIVETDASGTGLGAVLMQDQHPIAFFSKVLGIRAQMKPIYERELMAIVFAVLKWLHYLLGRQFVVKTDQSSLKFLWEQREIGAEYQRRVTKFMGFDFDIVYNPGASNRVADALSRRHDEVVTLAALWSSQNVDWAELDAEIMRDPLLSSLRERVAKGEEVLTGFRLLNGQLWYKDHLVIPKNSTFIPSLLKEYHDSPIGGHTGEHKTYARIAAHWFWEGMRRQINDYVKQCSTCQ